MEEDELKNYLKASEVAKKVKPFAMELVKPGAPLLEIAEKVEAKIIEEGARPAFPVNISINENAAHYTPSAADAATLGEKDLVKIDIGIHSSGFVVDFAFSVDCSGENTSLVEASEKALEAALSKMRAGVNVREVGKEIENAIKGRGFVPIRNLCGHLMEEFNLHAGQEIPNHAEGNYILKEGEVYAVEPFATLGEGKVVEGEYCEIFSLIEENKKVRLPHSRKLLEIIDSEFNKLPFAKRWIKDIPPSSLDLALADLLKQGIIRAYPVLREAKRVNVSQAETTVIIEKDGVNVLV
ncbi:type II methionyl aminopeptidase [Candidatus Micrarchaeota archaeon]|nr:type II methionyl aminopeptidase [Candidatus Micrarchaeota archaeon]